MTASKGAQSPLEKHGKNDSSPKQYLTASEIGVYYTNHCRKYLWLTSAKKALKKDSQSVKVEPSALSQARFNRGYKWEDVLRKELTDQDLILHGSDELITVEQLVKLAVDDQRSHFYIVDVAIQSPDFDRWWSGQGCQPRFGVFKPDFIEIWKTRNEKDPTIHLRWRIIDAKASRKIKISHQMQIGFYWLALKYLLEDFAGSQDLPMVINEADPLGAVWFKSSSLEATFSGGLFSLVILRPLLEQFLFRQLPLVLDTPLKDVPWRFKSVCASCDYVTRCRDETVADKRADLIPNLIAGEHSLIQEVLAYTRKESGISECEIEDLDRLVRGDDRDDVSVYKLRSKYPESGRRFEELVQFREGAVTLGGYRKGGQSSVIEAALNRSVTVKGKPCLIFPASEDVGVYFLLAQDPESGQLFGFSILVKYHAKQSLEQVSHMSEDLIDLEETANIFIQETAKVLRTLQEMQFSNDDMLRVQFYVFSEAEQQLLANLLVARACEASELADDLRVCIGALLDQTSVLRTTVQPQLLASNVIFRPTTKLRVGELRNYIRAFGGDTADLTGTKPVLLERLKGILMTRNRSQFSNGTARLLPRLCIIHLAIKTQLAIPEPGFYGLDEAAKWLLNTKSSRKDASEGKEHWLESLYTSWRLKDFSGAREVLEGYAGKLPLLVDGIRRRIAQYCRTNGLTQDQLLPNAANNLSIVYIETVQDKNLRRLMFMRQYELWVNTQKLITDRLNNAKCALLEFDPAARGKDPVFLVHSGLTHLNPPTVDPTSTKSSFAMYTWILVREWSNADYFFDDLDCCDTYYMKLPTGGPQSANLAFAEVDDVWAQEGGPTRVRLLLKRSQGFPLQGRFWLKPRLVDFNVKKIVKTLIELDECSHTSVDRPLFLRMLDNINDVGTLIPRGLDATLKQEKRLETLYREIAALQPGKSEMLKFTRSQRKAFTAILSRSVTLLWGPPGHGKTHTLALSALRLIELAGRDENVDTFRVMMVAYTNTAIQNFIRKVTDLIAVLKSIEGLENSSWLKQIEVVSLSSSNCDVNATIKTPYSITAGTVWSFWKCLDSTPAMGEHFDALLIDEGSQMPVADAAIAIKAVSSGRSKFKRIIVAGDHLQLAPVFHGIYPREPPPGELPLFGSILDCLMQGRSPEDVLQSKSLEKSQSLQGSQLSLKQDAQLGPLTTMLSENFRMLPALCEFTNTIYRSGGLFEPQRQDVGISWKALPKSLQHIFGTRNPMITLQLEPTSVNGSIDMLPLEEHLRCEARVVSELVQELLQATDGRIFVITPHRIQRSMIKAILPDDLDLSRVRVDTVERMQGDEADIVMTCFGFTSHASRFESELDFIFHRNRLNVALSRARSLCVLIASERLVNNPPEAVLETRERREAFAHLRTFVDRSQLVPWKVDMGISDIAASPSLHSLSSLEYGAVVPDPATMDVLAKMMDNLDMDSKGRRV
ncbi:hypothetical protein DFS34DRAFT_149922 [Phlyctochytrium arcticum]|nr:hypothetical protein DFS34DRAFT_149922 [Phlyctochytrium arcticum]